MLKERPAWHDCKTQKKCFNDQKHMRGRQTIARTASIVTTMLVTAAAAHKAYERELKVSGRGFLNEINVSEGACVSRP